MSAPSTPLNIILAARSASTNPHPAGWHRHLASAFTRASSTDEKAHWRNAGAILPAYDKLTAEGVEGLHYVEGEHLLGDDDEATTDSSHPSDLGMMRMADALEPVLRAVLSGQ